jgi:uncharacterized protein (DUF2062 family)
LLHRVKRLFNWKGYARWMKYKYLLLLRAKGGAAMVAMGFSLGLAIEMFTLPTFGLAFFLMFPAVWFFRASFASALIGFVFGKLIYPFFFFINKSVGGWLVPRQLERHVLHSLPHWLERLLFTNIKLIVGGIIVGAVLGVAVYFPMKLLLEFYTEKRKKKRKLRKAKVYEL